MTRKRPTPGLIGLQPILRAPEPEPFLHHSDWRAKAFYAKTGRKLSYKELHKQAAQRMERFDALPPSLRSTWNTHGATAVKVLLKLGRKAKSPHAKAILAEHGIQVVCNAEEIGI